MLTSRSFPGILKYIIALLALMVCGGRVFGVTVTPELEALYIENVSTSWQTVSLDNSYSNAIPVCTYNLGTFAGSNPNYTNLPAVPRIRNITSDSFELRIQGWEDTSASAGDVHCIVAESGAHTLPDGRQYEARSVLSDNTVGQFSTDGGWSQALLEDVSGLVTGNYASPVVLGQVISFNDSRASVINVSDCTNRANRPFQSGMSGGICVGNHIGTIAGDRAAETIGFIIAEAGSGTANNVPYELAQGADQVLGNNNSNSGYSYSLNGDHNIGVLTQAGEDGGNGSWAVLYGADPLPANRLNLAVDEEIFATDTSRNHTTEPIDYWVFTASELTLVNNVTNDNGGGRGADDFGLAIDGVAALSGTPYPVLPGATVQISEDLADGYTTGTWSCIDANGLATGLPAAGSPVATSLSLPVGADVTCEITNNDIAPVLTLVKQVVNDNGGTLSVAEVDLFVDAATVVSGLPGQVNANTAIVISESVHPGYSETGWSCVDLSGFTSGLPAAGAALGETITLAEGANVTCSMTNDDIAPTLTLSKTVLNDDGGILAVDDFDISIDGTEVGNGTAVTLMANTPVTISELELPGYTEGTWSCIDATGITPTLPSNGTANGTDLSLLPGSQVTCSISNDDIAPTLTLVKNLTNDDGGSLAASDFELSVDGAPVTSGVAQDVQANTAIVISELDLPGYTTGTWSCTDSNGLTTGLPTSGAATATGIMLESGAAVTCEIDNNDIAPRLTLENTVLNDNGGDLLVGDFTLSIDGSSVSSGVSNTVTANTAIEIAELAAPGYAVGSWNCTDSAGLTSGLPAAGDALSTTISLMPGSVVNCAISNDDIAPTLTLLKTVINDNGGVLAVDDFDVSVEAVEVSSGVANTFTANSPLVISELVLPGYTEGSWSCSDATGITTGLPGSGAAASSTVTLLPGGRVTCAITNDDIAPTLTLSKTLINDNGGALSVEDFDISINGVEVVNGVATAVQANTLINISELDLPGYTGGNWSCSDANGLTGGLPSAGAADSTDITLLPGAEVTCAISSDDIAPTLTLNKTVLNNNGGTLTADDFDLSVDGAVVVHGVANVVQANTAIVISEADLAGYSEGTWSCVDSAGLTAGLPGAGDALSTSLNLMPGSEVSCAITNEDIAPRLTLTKAVVNDHGGNLSVADFALAIDGVEVLSGAATVVPANAPITISEPDVDGYTQGSWSCSDAAGITTGLPASGAAMATTLTLLPGSDVSCSISNNDIAPSLTLTTNVLNDNGGTLGATDFAPSVNGAEIVSGVPQSVNANISIDISELDLPGYTEGEWSCDDASGLTTGLPSSGSAGATSLTLASGAVVTCTIDNDDIAPTLTLNKTLTNDNGGDLTIGDFDIAIDGSEVVNGVANTVTANAAIVISELDVAGYTAGSWSCSDANGITAGLPGSGPATSTTLTLLPGSAVSCAISNNDIAPTLTLSKSLTNDNGGSKSIGDFALSIDGNEVVSGIATTVVANTNITISELDLPGYTSGAWSCNDANGITAGLPAGGLATGTDLSLLPGSAVTCSISNDDIGPTLTLFTAVTNDDGGDLSATDFNPSIDGVEVTSGDAQSVQANSLITISELELPGYNAGSWSCNDTSGLTTGLPVESDATSTTLTLAAGAVVSCTIVNDDIPPTLALNKTVINDNGGNLSIGDFSIAINGSEVDNGVSNTVLANSVITISEFAVAGYTAGTWACSDAAGLTPGLPVAGAGSGTDLTLLPGSVVSCAISNDDIAPTLTLVNTVINDDGGDLTIDDFDLTIDGVEVSSGFTSPVTANADITISELVLDGYAGGSWSCTDASGLTVSLPASGNAAGTTVNLMAGADVTCAISNDDIAPSLTLTKTLINDNGGNLSIDDFDLAIDGIEVASGVSNTVTANTTITISELDLPGYSEGSWACTDASGLATGLPTVGDPTATGITLLPGSDVSCVITNDDIPPSLTLIKTLTNDNGGDLSIADFDLSIDGTEVTSGAVNPVMANRVITISELALAGYTSGSWSCSDATGYTSGLPASGAATGTDITLAAGAVVSCQIANDDIAPQLTLNKIITNDNGGSAVIGDFALQIDGVTVVSGDTQVVQANTDLVISEPAMPGYTRGTWSCTDSSGLTTGLPIAGDPAGTTLNLPPGSTVNCGVINNDVAPTLTLVKTVINDNGGNLLAEDFDISIDGSEVDSGVAITVTANTAIVISELEVAGYSSGSWSCIDANGTTGGLPSAGDASATTITLSSGAQVTCSITNDDNAPTLTLVKNLINDDGGNLAVDDFDIAIDGTEVISGVSTAVTANAPVTISELDLPGYTPGTWSCSDAAGLTSGLPTAGAAVLTEVTLLPGSDVTCAISNNDIAPLLTLNKSVVNDNGGDLTVADFEIAINGLEVISGAATTVVANTDIVIGELLVDGYAAGSWACSDSTGLTSGLPAAGSAESTTLNLLPGSVVSCVISNDDIAPTLTLVKTLLNDDGGSLAIDDFDLSIDGVVVDSGVVSTVQANSTIVVSELDLAGYTEGAWLCSDANSITTGLPVAGSAAGTSLTLLPGSEVSCSITNDDVGPTLTLLPSVVNDNGGLLLPADFEPTIDGEQVMSGAVEAVLANTPITISELDLPGYSEGTWSCVDGSGLAGGLPTAGSAGATTLTLAEGSAVVCSIVNDDIAPSLTLTKNLINDDGGDLSVEDFDIAIDGLEVGNGLATLVAANTDILVSELAVDGYSAGQWLCSDASGLTSGLPANGAATGTTIKLEPGAVVNCGITNNDIAPTLTLVNAVTNDDGGTLSADDFELNIDGTPVLSGAATTVAANSVINIGQLLLPGYTAGSWQCTDANSLTSGLASGLPLSGDAASTSLTLSAGAAVTCSVVNGDIAPTLTLVKTLINDDGGNLAIDDFDISIDGVETGNGVGNIVAANTVLTISERHMPGYTAGTWACSDANDVTAVLPGAGTATGTEVMLAPGSDVTCSISNDDIAPTLTLSVSVINDNGGEQTIDDFDISVDGSEVMSGVAGEVIANTDIVISELDIAGYLAGSWLCEDSKGLSGGLPTSGNAMSTTLNLEPGSVVSCSIVNNDIPPTLTLTKTVINDHGGLLSASDFDPSIDGIEIISGDANTIDANTAVEISEQLAGGYAAGQWSCVDTAAITTGLPVNGDATGTMITVLPGAKVNCSITNDDIAPTLTLVNNVVNDDGGLLTSADFNQAVDGVEVISGSAMAVDANKTVSISELVVPGYAAGVWSCVDASGLTVSLPDAGPAFGTDITLVPGAVVTCAITNNDIAPQLTLLKTLINNNGGIKTIDDFDLSIDGVEVSTGTAYSLAANSDIVISEADLPGYVEGSWACADSTGLSTDLPTAGLATGETISLAPGAMVNCEITNEDYSATLTLLSNVINDNGGSAVPDDFGLTLDGVTVASGAALSVNVNTPFDIAELDLPGYSEGVWSCTDSTGLTTGLPVAGAAGSASVTLAGGAQVTCEITNNDIAPSLTLVKSVVNDNGGVLTGTDFDLMLDGNVVSSGIANPVMGDTTITISEVAVAGYEPGSWNCVDANDLTTGLPVTGSASGASLSLPAGAAVTCEITNNDIPPTLTLVSNVVNDHGGLLGSGDFAPSIDGVEVVSASVQTVTANTLISIGELDLPGYEEGAWSCVDANSLSTGLLTAGVATGDSVSLVPGAAVTCTIINDDIAPTLTLVKTVVNDDGGNLEVDDFELSIDGLEVSAAVAQTVNANAPVVISERSVPGYTNGQWSCSDSTSLTASLPTAGAASATTLNLAPGAAVTCAIENNDVAPLLTLIKTVNNDNGGKKTVTDFALSVDGNAVASGASQTVEANTPIEIGELNLPAYAEGSWACVDASGLTSGLPDSGDATSTFLTLAPGSQVTCSITNNDLGIDLSIVKTVDNSTPEIGAVVAFTLSVTNAGPDTASGIVVTDPLPAGFSYVAGSISGGDAQADTSPGGSGLQWMINSLSAGDEQTLRFSAVVNASPMTTVAMTNVATVAAGSDQFESVLANNTASVQVLPKALDLKKLADSSGVSTPSAAGDLINYTITAVNTGLLPLTEVVLTDSIIASTDLSLTGDTDNNGQIDPAEIWQWQGSYALTQADLDSNGGGNGEINNVALLASAELTDQTAEVAVPITRVVDYTVTKQADAGQIAVPGPVAYTIAVTNTGNVSLNNIQAVDTLPDGTIAVLSGPVADTGDNAVLDVGETWVFNTSYSVSQADIDAGDVLENTVTVSTDETGPPGKIATAQTTISNRPEFSLSKTVDRADVSAPGVLSYVIEVENTGNTTLTDITLLDTLPDGSVVSLSVPDTDTGISGAIDVGETWQYNTTYDVSQTEIDAGLDLINRVEVTTQQTDTALSDEALTSITTTPSFEVEKRVDQTSISGPVVLNYTISVENTGNVSLDGIALNDLLPDGTTATLSGPAGDIDDQGVLNVGETWQYTTSYPVTQTNIDTGIDLVNQVTVSSHQTGTYQQTASAVTTVVTEPDIAVSKTVDISSVDAPTVLSYEIVVENTGNLSLSNLLVADILPDGTPAVLNGPVDEAGVAGVLDVGESWRFTTAYSVTQADIDLGLPRTNTVSVSSEQTTDAVFTASAVTTIDSRPSFTVDKTVDVTELTAPGTLHYEILIANTGNTSLSGVDVMDTMPDGSAAVLTGPTGDGGAAGVLDVGEVWTYTAQYSVSQSVVDSGVALVNEVIVETTEAGIATDSVTTIVSQSPSLSIVKSTDSTGYEKSGDVIAYKLLVKNTGNLMLDNVLVTDVPADPASVVCEQSMPFSLSPAQSVQCDATITVTTTHISELSIDNTAGATATDPMGGVIEAQSALVTVAMNLIAPLAVDDSDSASASGAVITLQVTTNDSDGNDDLLSSTLSLQSEGAIDTNADGYADTLTVEGEGQWLVDGTLGTVTFTPLSGFTADPAPVSYVVSDAAGLISNVATLTIDYPQNAPTANDDHKLNPAPPAPENPTTVNVVADNGSGADEDSEGDLNIASVAFVIEGATDSDDDGYHDTIVVAGEGTWSVNHQGLVTFTPAEGFFGDPTPVQYTISDTNGLVSNMATITIDYPQSSPVASNDSLLDQPLKQAVTLSVVDNDTDPENNIDPASVRLIAPESGAAVLSLSVAGEGLWTIDEQTGDLSFIPEPGFLSDPTPVFYQVSDTTALVSNVATVTVTYEAPAILQGTVWLDRNGDGEVDANENRKPGWTLIVRDDDGNSVATTVTDANGDYLIEGLVPAVYTVEFYNESMVFMDALSTGTSVLAGQTINLPLPVDPSGVVYDSVSRLPVAGVQLFLFNSRGVAVDESCVMENQQGQVTEADGLYAFDIIPSADNSCGLSDDYRLELGEMPAEYHQRFSTLIDNEVAAACDQANPNCSIDTFDSAPTETGCTIDTIPDSGACEIQPQSSAPATDQDTRYYLAFRIASGDTNVIHNHLPVDALANDAELLLSKTVNKSQVSIGGQLQYLITVENLKAIDASDIQIHDLPPAGFKIDPQSVRLIRAGEDAAFDTEDDKVESLSLTVAEDITFRSFTLEALETARIRYSMKVGTGVVNGSHHNRATATGPGGIAVNTVSAAVTVTDDPVLAQATLIGKVFIDRDRDGSQDPADASGVRIRSSQFGPTGLTLPDLPGRNRLGEDPSDHAITINLPVDRNREFVISTDQGTYIEVDIDGRTTERHRGEIARGLNGQNINVCTHLTTGLPVLADGSIGEQEIDVIQITLTNHGVEEQGIPGVRLASVNGLIVETDAFGRFNVPDVVAARGGRNFILKVDPATLPADAELTTDNPQVVRMVSESLNRMNFGVVLPEQDQFARSVYRCQHEVAASYKTLEVRLGSVFFDVGSAEVREDQQGIVFDIGRKLRDFGGGEIIVQAHADSTGDHQINIALAERRADSIRRLLMQSLGQPVMEHVVVRVDSEAYGESGQ